MSALDADYLGKFCVIAAFYPQVEVLVDILKMHQHRQTVHA